MGTWWLRDIPRWGRQVDSRNSSIQIVSGKMLHDGIALEMMGTRWVTSVGAGSGNNQWVTESACLLGGVGMAQ